MFSNRTILAGAALAALLTVAGCGGSTPAAAPAPSTTVPATSATVSPAPTTSTPDPTAGANPAGTAPAPAAADDSPLPVSLSVPAIGVTTGLQALGLNTDGSLQAPTGWNTAGWYAGGVRPGQPGPAVIAGHVDSAAYGPAVFYKLRDLAVGDKAYVTRKDGTKLTFVIDSIKEYPKNKFPTAAVYGPTALQVLRLVTCTGDFDAKAHSYVDNLVVSAHLQTLFG